LAPLSSGNQVQGVDTFAADRGCKERLRDALQTNGISIVRGIVATDADLLHIAGWLGAPKAEVRDAVFVKSISPTPSREAPRNTLSEMYGLGQFPLHTDAAYWEAPPRFILFYCIHPGSGQRPTVLVDTRQWRLARPERRALQNEVWVIHRTHKPFLCTHSIADGHGGFRVDYECMRPAVRDCTSASKVVASAIAITPKTHVEWQPGDLVVIDNRRMLHGRGKANASDQDRVLKRVLIE
jgi:alpha-ketoglutarate-dependent taurine dioxygenase